MNEEEVNMLDAMRRTHMAGRITSRDSLLVGDIDFTVWQLRRGEVKYDDLPQHLRDAHENDPRPCGVENCGFGDLVGQPSAEGSHPSDPSHTPSPQTYGVDLIAHHMTSTQADWLHLLGATE